MMNFVKVHMMAVNYVNAAKLDDPVAGKDLTQRERYFAEPLRERVPFMDFVHYFLFCGAAWTGMSHEYRYFDDFINCKGDYANIPKNGLFLPALKRFAQCLACLVAFIILASNVSYKQLLTEEYAQASFAYKAVMLVAAVHLKVVSCYIGFTAMEANFIACGQSYRPASTVKDKDGKVVEHVPEDFFAIKQIRIWVFET